MMSNLTDLMRSFEDTKVVHLWLGSTLFTFLWLSRSSSRRYSSICLSFSCFSLFFLSFATCMLWSSVASSMSYILFRFSSSSWPRCCVLYRVCWSYILLVFFILSLICFFSLICSSRYYFWICWYYFLRSSKGWSSPIKKVSPELSWVCCWLGLGLK